jgi:hypothetical protein
MELRKCGLMENAGLELFRKSLQVSPRPSTSRRRLQTRFVAFCEPRCRSIMGELRSPRQRRGRPVRMGFDHIRKRLKIAAAVVIGRQDRGYRP